jgi:predicted ribonuclease YlaK
LSDPEIRHNQMILHEGIKKFISSGVEQRCFIVEGGAGTGKTLLALQILRRKLREIEKKEEKTKEEKVEGENKIRVSYVTSSKHMNDFFHSESLLSPYLDSRYAQSFNKIGNMVEKDLLICDETQNATNDEIKEIIKNKGIKKIIFFFGENQFTNRAFPKELNNLKKLNKLSSSHKTRKIL